MILCLLVERALYLFIYLFVYLFVYLFILYLLLTILQLNISVPQKYTKN